MNVGPCFPGPDLDVPDVIAEIDFAHGAGPIAACVEFACGFNLYLECLRFLDPASFSAEVLAFAPEAVLRAEWQSHVSARSEMHPRGTLPTELRSFDAFMRRVNTRLSEAEKQRLKCLLCGMLPYCT